MRKFIRGGLMAAAATTAVVGLTMAPAHAATLWDLQGNGNADDSYTAQLVSGTQVVFTDVTTNQTVRCDTSTASGKAANQSAASGAGIANIADADFSDCSGPLGSVFTAWKNNTSPWDINAQDPYDATNDTTPASITNVSVAVDGSTLLGNCDGSITGSIDPGYFDNTDHTLHVNSTNATLTIHISDGSGCADLFNEGDKATVQMVYAIDQPITIRPAS